jgi:hypothetical protein
MCERGLQPGSTTADAASPLNQSSCGTTLGTLRKQLAPSFHNNSTSACRWCRNHHPTGTAACAPARAKSCWASNFCKIHALATLATNNVCSACCSTARAAAHTHTSHSMQLWRPRTIAPAAYCLALSCVLCCCHQCSSVGIVLLQQQQQQSHTAVNDGTSRRSRRRNGEAGSEAACTTHVSAQHNHPAHKRMVASNLT